MSHYSTRWYTRMFLGVVFWLSACAGTTKSAHNAASILNGGVGNSTDSPTGNTGLQITTTSLPTGVLSQQYLATLAVGGGVAPYSWKLVSGQVPGGLSFVASAGQITGLPNQAGTFALTIQAGDSSSAVQIKTFNLTIAPTALDSYGGTVQMSCPNGTASHFYSEKVNGRWWLCTPAGNAFWLKGVYHAEASDSSPDYQGVTLNGSACSAGSPPSPGAPCSEIVAKYGDANLNWGPQTVQRMRSWGFNATAEYASAYVLPTTISSWQTTDHTNPQKMAFVGLVWPSHYARNANSYANPVKDIVHPISSGVYSDYRAPSPDIWDPNFAQWLQRDLADPSSGEYAWIHNIHNDYLIGLNVDDTDELMGFGAGTDFKTLTDGNLDNGTGRQHPHLAWMILITPPTQSAGLDGNGNPIGYSDTTVYSKLALSNWLSNHYGGNISALNAAWGANYSTFGSNGGWGSGSGLLDEDGTDPWVPRDAYSLSDGTAAMRQDLDAFLLVHAQQYFSIIRGVLNAEAPGVLYLGPTTLGTWGAPPRRQILQAAGQYLDIISLSSIPTGCLTCTDDQQRIDFIAQYGGDKPWIAWEGFFAQPDSYMSVFAPADTSMAQAALQTQRAQQFQTMIAKLIAMTDTPTGTFHFVGYKWWELYDNRGEQANWGLMTRRDNAYDGVAAVIATGTDARGFATGGELANYGNFLGGVTTSNLNVYKAALGLP